MVIIVPTLTEGNQSNKCIVSTLIPCIEAFFSKQVSNGIELQMLHDIKRRSELESPNECG